jgi:hypothetical protein
MSKLNRRGYLAISTIAAASALLVVAPAGASAAEEPAGGSTSGETAAEPSGDSTQPAAETEWTPQDVEGGTSGGGSPPLEHGSSVGSGAVREKAEPDSEEPSHTSEPSGSYEPAPSIPATVDEPASTPQAESGSGVHPVQPRETATPARVSRPVEMAVGSATSLGHSASPQGDGVSSAPPAVPVSLADSGDSSSTTSYALPLLAIVVLGVVLGFASVRLKRYRRRRQLEALWREQDAAWEAAVLRFEPGQVPGVAEPSAQPSQRAKSPAASRLPQARRALPRP